jgi:hypothetical protein
VKMTIDHVQPKALGGTDEPSNLVAACADCNGGKSSSSATASQVAQVSADAVRWAAAIKQAAEESALHQNTEVYEAVVNAWTSFRRKQIPGDYMETIDQFLKAGLPAEDIVQMARVADSKPSIYDRWKYFCGCCWTRLTQLQERATEILNDVQEPTPEPPPKSLEAASLFPPADPVVYSLSSLFDRGTWRETRYGYMDEEMYQRRLSIERAKQQARFDCPMCDNNGYRPNGYLCDHVDHEQEKRSRLSLVEAEDG